MIAYIIRRVLYAFPLLLGINLITFVLFFVVNSPDDMAKNQLGHKHTTPQQIEDWKRERGYDLPLVYNEDTSGIAKFTETIFYQKSIRLFVFEFGSSDSGRDISYDISNRMWPSLTIAVPHLIVGLLVTITFAIPNAIFIEAFLSFIGMGVAPPTPSWGSMSNEGIKTMLTHPHELVLPALFISITVLAFNLLGDGLRDALDARMRNTE